MTADPSFLSALIERDPDRAVMAWRGQVLNRGTLRTVVDESQALLEHHKIGVGTPVLLKADYAPQSVAMLLALIANGSIIIPLLPSAAERSQELIDIVEPDWIISVDDDGQVSFEQRKAVSPNDFYQELARRQCPGLVLFTSGSTGTPKAVVHDFSKLLEKFRKPRPATTVLNFMMFDHWGGLNTLLHCLATGSLVVLPEQRSPEYICELIEHHGVELLPATPTFLNLLLISRAFENRDMSSLKLITYGAEPMLSSTLEGLGKTFPGVEFRQTYGMIELGVLRAQSKSSSSLWIRIGGEGYDVRVVDGILQIKADAAMLGYLNAPSPFTDDGYFITGDRVEESGDFMRILGRDSELINVGGQKVFPAEVEAVLVECEEVEDAVVYGLDHPLTGKIVCATVKCQSVDDVPLMRQAIKRYCNQRLEAFKVPVKIQFTEEPLHGERQKRMRRRPVSPPDEA